MDESSARFRVPKTFDEDDACVINSIPKSWALQIFREQKSKKCITTSDVKISHDVNKGKDADKVSSLFQGVTFDKCNIKLVINSTNCDNM